MWTIYNNYLSKSFIIFFFFTAYVTEISRERFSAIILSLTLKLFYFFRKTESLSTRTNVHRDLEKKLMVYLDCFVLQVKIETPDGWYSQSLRQYFHQTYRCSPKCITPLLCLYLLYSF